MRDAKNAAEYLGVKPMSAAMAPARQHAGDRQSRIQLKSLAHQYRLTDRA